MTKNLIIAIDGPAGSGKSTTAKLLADRLNYFYIDTGAMYRAVTYLALKNGIVNDHPAVIALLDSISLDLSYANGVTRVFLNGEEVTDQIRTKEVNANVSPISTIREVRKKMVALQREMGNRGGVVMEGRDIGTAVFPHAHLKVFLTAGIDQRAVRRLKEFEEKSIPVTLDEIKMNLQERDRIDSSRCVDPLTKAEGAFEVDTSNTSIEEQVSIIEAEARRLMELG